MLTRSWDYSNNFFENNSTYIERANFEYRFILVLIKLLEDSLVLIRNFEEMM